METSCPRSDDGSISSQRIMLNDRMTSTSSCLPSPSGESLRGGESNDRTECARGRGLLSPMPEGPAIKNKWKVHWDTPPVERKVCLENTESRILFERIKLIKQFAEKRRAVMRERKCRWQNLSSCADHLWRCYGKTGGLFHWSNWIFAFVIMK